MTDSAPVDPLDAPITIDPATFPADIRVFDASSFTAEMEDVSVQPQDTDGGYFISRPRFTRAPRRSWSFKFVDMHDRDRKALESFWVAVKGRSNAFNWTNPETGEVVNVRFGDMKPRFTRTGYGSINRWDSDTVVIQEL